MNRRLEPYRDLCVELLEDKKRPSDFRRQFIAAYWADRTKWTPPEKRLLQDLAFILRELDDDFSIRQASEMSLRSMLLMEEPAWFDKALATSKLFNLVPGILIFVIALGTWSSFHSWITPIAERLQAETASTGSATDVECRVGLVGDKTQNAGLTSSLGKTSAPCLPASSPTPGAN